MNNEIQIFYWCYCLGYCPRVDNNSSGGRMTGGNFHWALFLKLKQKKKTIPDPFLLSVLPKVYVMLLTRTGHGNLWSRKYFSCSITERTPMIIRHLTHLSVNMWKEKKRYKTRRRSTLFTLLFWAADRHRRCWEVVSEADDLSDIYVRRWTMYAKCMRWRQGKARLS